MVSLKGIGWDESRTSLKGEQSVRGSMIKGMDELHKQHPKG